MNISTTSTIARWKSSGELKCFHLWRKLLYSFLSAEVAKLDIATLFKPWAFQAYLGTDCRSVLHRLHRSTTAESCDTDLCSESKSDELSTGSCGLDPRFISKLALLRSAYAKISTDTCMCTHSHACAVQVALRNFPKRKCVYTGSHNAFT